MPNREGDQETINRILEEVSCSKEDELQNMTDSLRSMLDDLEILKDGVSSVRCMAEFVGGLIEESSAVAHIAQAIRADPIEFTRCMVHYWARVHDIPW